MPPHPAGEEHRAEELRGNDADYELEDLNEEEMEADEMRKSELVVEANTGMTVERGKELSRLDQLMQPNLIIRYNLVTLFDTVLTYWYISVYIKTGVKSLLSFLKVSLQVDHPILLWRNALLFAARDFFLLHVTFFVKRLLRLWYRKCRTALIGADMG